MRSNAKKLRARLAVAAFVSLALAIGPTISANAVGEGSISGTVYLGSTATPAGAGEATVFFVKYLEPINPADSVQTDASGNFNITGLDLARYQLFYQYNGAGPYVGNWNGRYANQSQFPLNQWSGAPSIQLTTTYPTARASNVINELGEISGVATLGADLVPGVGEVTVKYRSDPWPGSGVPGAYLSITADVNGRYTIPDLVPGWYVLLYEYSGAGNFHAVWPTYGGYSPAVVNKFVSGALTVDIPFPPLRTIAGTVSLGSLDLPAGAGDVTVTALSGSNEFDAVPIPRVQPALTDSAGNYQINGIPSGSIMLRFAYNGTGAFRSPMYLERFYPQDADPPVDFTILPAITGSGHVSIGTPLTPAGLNAVKVTLHGESGPEPKTTLTAYTDSEGDWFFENVPVGPYRLCIEDLGATNYGSKCWQHSPSKYGADRLQFNQSLADLDMILGADGKIQGTVAAPSGAKIVGASVRLTGIFIEGTRRGETLIWEASTNVWGTYGFESLPEEELLYVLEFEAEGFAYEAWADSSYYYYPDIIDLLAPELPIWYSTVLDQAGTISGAVSGTRLSASTAPLVTAEVMVYDGLLRKWVETGDKYPVDADGSYVVPGLHTGIYKLAFEYAEGGVFARVVSPEIAVGPASSIAYSPILNIPPLVTRLAGADRYAVGISVSRALNPDPVGEVDVVFIANGGNFPDALSAAPAAVHLGGPLLLTQSASLTPSVRDEITRLSPTRIVIVGGSQSVSLLVENQLKSLVGSENVDRLGGPTRYAASRAVIRDAWDIGADSFPVLYVTSGANYPDAMSASAAAGAIDAPLLLVPGSSTSLDAETIALIREMRPGLIKIAGGSVSPQLRAALATLAPIRFLGGADRLQVSQAVNADAFTSSSKVYLTTAFNYPDGLVGAALAGQTGAPLYTVPSTCVPSAVLAQIDALGASEVILLGGTGTLSNRVSALQPCVSGDRVLGLPNAPVATVEAVSRAPRTAGSLDDLFEELVTEFERPSTKR